MPGKRRTNLPPEAYDRVPRVQLTLGKECIWLTRFDEKGYPTVTYPVSASDVAAAFNAFGSDTGLLPLDTLFWQNCGGQLRIGVWLPPAMRTLTFSTQRDERLKVPLPGLVFVGLGAHYYVYATRQRPVRSSDQLYLAPLSNIYGDGRICSGTAKFPRCDGASITQAVKLFFESAFNSDLANGKVMLTRGQQSLVRFYRSLVGQSSFPLNRLLPSSQPATMQDLMETRP